MPIIIGEFVQSLEEKAMSSKERNDLKDDEFGIPELRKYPIHDKKHVNQAIKMFNHVEPKYEEELADNLLDAMERFHISIDTVGEKNRLRKYIKEDSVVFTEGLIWNDNTPEDIKKLKENIKDILDDNKNKVDSVGDLVDTVQDVIKNRDTRTAEKKIFTDACKKARVKTYGYTVESSKVKGIEISTYHVLGSYKDYIITLIFVGTAGQVKLTYININYSPDKCDIPKNVVFDIINMVHYVDKVKCTRRSIKISALTKEIDSGYPRVSHKYSNKYNVKKSFAGTSITVSTLKGVKESVVAAALPPQGYNPNDVYIVNYMMKNTFVNDLAICKDKMSSIFVCKDGKPVHMSLTDFNEMATNIKVYKCLNDTDFDQLLKSSNCGLDFYKNIVNEEVSIDKLESDYRFEHVASHLDELNAIYECVLNSAPKSGYVNEVYCPIIPLVDLNEEGSIVHYYRDTKGVFAQNINTLNRTLSYKSVDDIPQSAINILSHF